MSKELTEERPPRWVAAEARRNSGLYPLFQPRMLRLSRQVNWEGIIGAMGGGVGLGILGYGVLRLLGWI